LLLHEVGEDAGVGGEAREGEAEVLVDCDYFFLVGGEFFCVALKHLSVSKCKLVVRRKEREDEVGDRETYL
jgi:hypothetical protein